MNAKVWYCMKHKQRKNDLTNERKKRKRKEEERKVRTKRKTDGRWKRKLERKKYMKHDIKRKGKKGMNDGIRWIDGTEGLNKSERKIFRIRGNGKRCDKGKGLFLYNCRLPKL